MLPSTYRIQFILFRLPCHIRGEKRAWNINGRVRSTQGINDFGTKENQKAGETSKDKMKRTGELGILLM